MEMKAHLDHFHFQKNMSISNISISISRPFPFPPRQFGTSTYPQNATNYPEKTGIDVSRETESIRNRKNVKRVSDVGNPETHVWKWIWPGSGNGNGLEMANPDHFHFHFHHFHFHFWTSKLNLHCHMDCEQMKIV